MASPFVRAVTVEANEFPRLSAQFNVRGVPQTVVNREGVFVGALPERDFVTTALRHAGIEVDVPATTEDGATTDLS